METGDDLAFLERWALSEDRATVLADLAPGTTQHFGFLSLLAEQLQYPDDLEATIQQWIGYFPIDVHRNKKLLKLYDVTRGNEGHNKEALQFLRDGLGISYNHARAVPAHETDDVDNTPSVLDQAGLTADALVAKALADAGDNVLANLRSGNFAHEHPLVLAAATKSGEAMWRLIDGVGQPDCGNIDLTIAALKDSSLLKRNMSDSIAARVFPRMTLDQLYEAGARASSVTGSEEWVAAVLGRLAPPAGVDFRLDSDAYDAYLDSVWAFLADKPATLNLVRLAVLYRRLEAIQKRSGALDGQDAQRWLRVYLELPRVNAPHWMAGYDVFKREATSRAGAWVNVGSRTSRAAKVLAVEQPSRQEDEAIIRDALMDILASSQTDSLDPWLGYVTPSWLKHLQAEARLTRGSDADRLNSAAWMRQLQGSASDLAALAARTTLILLPNNKEYYGADDDVTLHFAVKRIAKVTINVYEINTTAYYMDKGCEITTGIELDGLISHETLAREFDTVPLVETRVALPLASLSGHRRGVFVVELIGGGVSCRALLRKGQLRYLERTTVAGHLFTVVDESNAPAPAHCVSIWMAGRQYVPDGASSSLPEILIPFGHATRQQNLILTVHLESWSFSTLHTFSQRHESYTLEAAFYLDRESVIRDSYEATLLIRPRLLLLGSIPAPLQTLTDVTLTVTSADQEGIRSQRVQRNFQLHPDKESTFQFAVPPSLRVLEFALSADVELLATGARQTLTASHKVLVNGIDDSSDTRDVYLRYVATAGYCVYLLGKTGEPCPGHKLQVSLEHGLVSRPERRTLKTDAVGKVALGHLAGFARVDVTFCPSDASASPRSVTFDLPRDTYAYPTTVHTTTAGEAATGIQARVPFRPGGSGASEYQLTRQDARLIETRVEPSNAGSVQQGGQGSGVTLPVKDYFQPAHIAYDAATGFILVRGLPPGEYALTVKRPFPNSTAAAPEIKVRVLEARRSALRWGWLCSGEYCLRTRAGHNAEMPLFRPGAPLQIASVAKEGADIVIRVSGGSSGGATLHASGKDARVHVISTVFVPPWDVGASLSGLSIADLPTSRWSITRSRYLSGRTLSEEYKYILDRKAIDALPGNLLPRPALLLNPWSLGSVATDTQEAKGGTDYATVRDHVARVQSTGLFKGAAMTSAASSVSHGQRVNLDFLHGPSTTLLNLKPDPATGLLRLPVAQLSNAASAGCIYLSIVAVDSTHTAATHAAIPIGSPSNPGECPLPSFRNLALAGTAIDINGHAVLQNKITPLSETTGACDMSAAATYTKVETYGSLDRAFGLLAALSSNSQLAADFAWLLLWARLSPAERCGKYSQYACHEVNLLLYFKDPAFFNDIIRPFLSCKRSKSFIDHWLLGNDMSPYAELQAFQELNAAEKALLACCVGEEDARSIVRYMADYVEASPTSPATREAIFKAALAGNVLEGGGVQLNSLLVLAEAEKVEAAQRKQVPPEQSFRVESLVRPMNNKSVPRHAAAPRHLMALSTLAAGPPGMPVVAAAAVAPPAPRLLEVGELCGYESDGPSADLRVEQEDLSRRTEARGKTLFRPLDKTEEYVEMHYYRVPRTEDTGNLLRINDYWADFARYMASMSGSTAGLHGPARLQALTAAMANKPFLSQHFAVATANLNEMLLALAVLGLPCESSPTAPPVRPNVTIEGEGSSIRYEARSTPLILFHQDLAQQPAVAVSSVLLGQSYFDPQDRYRVDHGNRVEKYLDNLEFRAGRVYGCRVVITNVSGSQQQLDVLLHIPHGSIAVSQGYAFRTLSVRLDAYSTHQLEYYFYFPRLGSYAHYPAHVASSGKLVAYASPTALTVVSRQTYRDTTSWQYVSQQGTGAEVLDYLATCNWAVTDLSQLCWRCHDATMYGQIVSLLRKRRVFHEDIWSYSLLHGDGITAKEYLQRTCMVSRIRSCVGIAFPYFISPLVSFLGEAGVGIMGDAVADAPPVLTRAMVGDGPHDGGAYEHLEYSPLVNARAHQLGRERKILNQAVERQFKNLLRMLCAKPSRELTPADLEAVAYHYLLQDRVGEAKRVFARVQPPPDAVARRSQSVPAEPSTSWSTLQYDYMAAYLDFYEYSSNDPAVPYTFPIAKAVAAAYANHPVPKWAAKFREIAAQLAEAGHPVDTALTAPAGSAAGTDISKELAREQQQSKAVSQEPSLATSLDGSTVVLTYSNLAQATLRFYHMDIELLFSTTPFLAGSNKVGYQDGGPLLGQFAYVRPNGSLVVDLPRGEGGRQGEYRVPIPPAFDRSNVMIDVMAAGIHRVMPYFANCMRVVIMESYGRLKVVHSDSGAPLARVYCKVYYRTDEADKGHFFKDGYTDIRGVFDYTALSTDELTRARRFAILIMSKEHGAVVKEALPPNV